MAGKSKSAKYYASNPEARKKKNAYDTALNSRKEQVQKRVEANRARRKAKAAGKDVQGKDYDHGSKRFIKSSTNRGKKSGTKGDKNARG